MTTPERLRRRQLRNDWFMAALAVVAPAVAFFFLVVTVFHPLGFARHSGRQAGAQHQGQTQRTQAQR